MKRLTVYTCVLFCLVFSAAAMAGTKAKVVKPHAGEKHFKWLKQLTFTGTNAEAYWSADGKQLIFQGRRNGQKCDQVYSMNMDGSNLRQIKANGGRFTCAYFGDVGTSRLELNRLSAVGKNKLLDRSRILFSSTSSGGKDCPKERDKSKGYVWEIFDTYEVYSAKRDGTDVQKITNSKGYDAESTVCDGKVVFASSRSGNALHIYTMNLDGSDVKQLTTKVGYNGGPFFSPDCKKIVYRAHHPKTPEAVAKFSAAVREGYIPPGVLEIHVMNADGSNKIQLTKMDKSSFAPSFYPENKQIIFSTNLKRETGVKTKKPQMKGRRPHRAFHLWAISPTQSNQTDGEQITKAGTFNGFPMFSPDGKYLVFSSNRNSKNPRNLHIFLARWQD